MTSNPSINIIVAVASDLAIGRAGDLLFHISADLRRFKELTMGHPIIMGRKTFESFPKGALPGRRNIVITRNRDYTAPGIETAASLDEAIALASSTADEIMIIGGGAIYAEAIPRADRLILTEVADPCPDADTFFPEYRAGWTLTDTTDPVTDPASGLRYRFATYRR